MKTVLAPQNLRALPKVELHRHLDCSLRWSTAVELARGLPRYRDCSAAELARNFLITEPFQDLASVLSKFSVLAEVLQSPEVLERLAFEVCEDAFNDGVRLLELRFAPTFIAEANPHLTPDVILNAFLRGLARAERTWPIATGLILIFQRTKPVPELLHLRDWALERRADFIGVDLADSEMDFAPDKFVEVFAPLAADWPITIHAGEIPHPAAASWVRDAIEKLGARRIGHGIQAIHNPELLRFLRDKNILLEVCPWSNYLTKSVASYLEHPLRHLLEQGQWVTLSTDDPGVFASSLVDEYNLALQLGLQVSDLEWMNDVACAGSFLPPQKIAKAWPRKRKAFSELIRPRSPKI